MHLTMQTQLLPDPAQASKLAATIKAFNAAADWLAGEAFALRSANKVKLQQLFYPTLRERFGLSSQMAIRCIADAGPIAGINPSVRVFGSSPRSPMISD